MKLKEFINLPDILRKKYDKAVVESPLINLRDDWSLYLRMNDYVIEYEYRSVSHLNIDNFLHQIANYFYEKDKP